MKIKKFRDFLLETRSEGPFEFVEKIDLAEELPDLFGQDVRFENWDPTEWEDAGLEPDETNEPPDFDTELEVWAFDTAPTEDEGVLYSLGLGPQIDPVDEDYGHVYIDPSWYSERVKLRLVWSDEEHGCGVYGPYGGSNEVVIYAGVPQLNRAEILQKFSDMYQANWDWFTT